MPIFHQVHRCSPMRHLPIVLSVLMAICATTSPLFAHPLRELPPGEDAVVTEIVDGDTIKVEIAGKPFVVRYIGIDAPEVIQQNSTYCYSAEATTANETLVINQTLRLEKDKSNVDRYGRLLRYAYLADGRMVNEELVKQGAAFAKRYRPDVKQAKRLEAAQQEAQTAKAGLWSVCTIKGGLTQVVPIVSRVVTATTIPSSTTTVADAAPVFTVEKGSRTRVSPEWYPCLEKQIKGNRNSGIYHAPGMRDYAFTFKSVECFNTRGEAEAAKYRAAKR